MVIGSGESLAVMQTSAAGARESVVVMVRLQPPAMLPASRRASSTTKSDHVPFGSVLSKTEKKVLVYGISGAGGGNESAVPGPAKLTGRKVPETICSVSGSAAAALSSKVRVTLFRAKPA